jgi:Fe2+ transport system protein B
MRKTAIALIVVVVAIVWWFAAAPRPEIQIAPSITNQAGSVFEPA